jgi:hypothetical protein
MRSSRREKQDARRRQEQEYRNVLEEGMKTPRAVLLPPLEGRQLNLVTVTEPPRALGAPNRDSVPSHPKDDVNDKLRLSKSNLGLVVLAYGLGIVGLGINAWFAWNRGTTVIDKVLLASLGFIAEAIMFYLPTQTSILWKQRRWGGFAIASVVCVCLFAFAVTNSQGFASLNLTEAMTARSERITPAVSDAQRRLDTLSSSRRDECLKRGERCRQLEKDEQTAIESLREARNSVLSTADPQIASAAKLVAWATLDRFRPSADDFAMLRLLLLTLLPQLGGLVLMLATHR